MSYDVINNIIQYLEDNIAREIVLISFSITFLAASPVTITIQHGDRALCI